MKFLNKYKHELIGVVVCLILGRLSGLSAKYGMCWAESLTKPIFEPPNWAFPIMWSLLYILMGITFGKLWRYKHDALLKLFTLQFIFNLLWSPIYFYFHKIDLALIDICITWLLLCAFMTKAYRGNLFMINLPYLLWLSFAVILNACIYGMN